MMKPKSVTTAVRLLWASLAIVVPRLWMESHGVWSAADLMFGVPILCIVILFIMGLIKVAGEGAHWARVTLLVIAVIEIPSRPVILIEEFGHSFASGTLALTQTVLQLAGVALLFTARSHPWFRQPAPADIP